MDGIQEDYRIDVLQRPVLLLLDHGHNLVGNIRYEDWRNLNSIKALQVVLNFPGTYPFGVKGYDLILDTGNALLVFLYDQGGILTIPVPGNLEIDFPVLATNGLFAVPVAPV